MVTVQNLKGEIIQLILSRKGRGHVPCKRNSTLATSLDLNETLYSCNTLPADEHEEIWFL